LSLPGVRSIYLRGRFSRWKGLDIEFARFDGKILCQCVHWQGWERATKRDRQIERAKNVPMPINSCSWGFNFSKSVCVCVWKCVQKRERKCVWLCRQFRACTRASHTPLMRLFLLFLSNLHACTPTSLSLYLTHTDTHTHKLCFYQFHQPRISISSTKSRRGKEN